MPKVTVYTIESVPEFARHAQDLLPDTSAAPVERKMEGNWYRGVGRGKTHGLKPGLFRHTSLKDPRSLMRLERVMLEDFRRQAVFHNETNNGNSEDADFRLLFIMQHYGIPTRLLDWSTNPLIALYFALSTAPLVKGRYAEEAAVWVMNPVFWNQHALAMLDHKDLGAISHGTKPATAYGPKQIINGELEASAMASMQERPAAILGIANNARMFAQRGVFTIFGKDLSPMEKQYEKENFPEGALVKIVIPKECISEMLIVLVRLGYTDSVSFPDLQGLAMEIRRSRGFGM